MEENEMLKRRNTRKRRKLGIRERKEEKRVKEGVKRLFIRVNECRETMEREIIQ